MKKETLETTLNNIKRLEWVNTQLEELSAFSIGLSEKDRKCKLSISFPNDEKKMILDEYGDLVEEDTQPSTIGSFILFNSEEKKNTDITYQLNINEVVSLNIIRYLQEGLLMEKQHIEGILLKQYKH